MKPPRLFAACDSCWEHSPETSCRYPYEIGWSPKAQRWLCEGCWPEEGEAEMTPPLRASDALPGEKEQATRLITAMAKKQMGVK